MASKEKNKEWLDWIAKELREEDGCLGTDRMKEKHDLTWTYD